MIHIHLLKTTSQRTDLKRLLAAVPPDGHVPADAADEVRDQRVELLGREQLWRDVHVHVYVWGHVYTLGGGHGQGIRGWGA